VSVVAHDLLEAARKQAKYWREQVDYYDKRLERDSIAPRRTVCEALAESWEQFVEECERAERRSAWE
jgi:hypothetical protein